MRDRRFPGQAPGYVNADNPGPQPRELDDGRAPRTIMGLLIAATAVAAVILFVLLP